LTSICRGLNPVSTYSLNLKVTNWEAHEWRMQHRANVEAQLKRFLERVGRRGSSKSVENALYHMSVFCSFLKLEPDEIPRHVKKEGVYEVLDEFVGWLVKDCGVAPHTLKNSLSISKKFLRLSGFEVSNDVLRSRVDMPRMFAKTVDRAPTLDELRRILLHTNSRGKAMVSMLASSGMRIGELLSLRVKDIDLARHPVTVFLRAEVTKDRQARFCFASDEASALLREYLGPRAEKPDECVFNTTTRGRAHATGNLPMTYWNADRIFTLAVRHSGLEQKDDYGRDVLHLHSLRKFFFSQLVPVLGREVVEALMGHKAFLDSSYRRFTMEQMAGHYLKGMDEVTALLRRQAPDEATVLATFNRQFLKISRYTDEEIEALGDLSKLSDDRLQELIDRKQLEKLGLDKGNRQKVVPMSELKKWVGEGWEYVTALPDGEAIVRLPPR
jgi:integrase